MPAAAVLARQAGWRQAGWRAPRVTQRRAHATQELLRGLGESETEASVLREVIHRLIQGYCPLHGKMSDGCRQDGQLHSLGSDDGQGERAVVVGADGREHSLAQHGRRHKDCDPEKKE